MSTHAARFRRVGRVHRMQRDTSKSGLVGEEKPELPKCPGTMTIALRLLNRAVRQGFTPPLFLAHLDVEYLYLAHGTEDGVHPVGTAALWLPLRRASPDLG